MAKTKTTTGTTTAEVKSEGGIAMKTMKSSSEVENFYRFILENNLRAEAHTLMRTVMDHLHPKKKRKAKKIQ